MARKDQYKMYQLSNVFISQYAFSQIVLDRYESFSSEEAWLVNYQDPHFNLIRVSLAAPFIDGNEEDRISNYIRVLQERTGQQIRFLDIHISREPYESLYEHVHLELEEDYAQGEDVHAFYPEIYQAIHQVENEEKEIFALASQMRKAIIERRKQLMRQRRPVCNQTVILICIILYLITYAMSLRYSFNSVLIFLGANYHTFTLGLKQYYRLILCGFLHGNFLHLFTNMYSLFFVGSYIERKYGGRKYLSMLLVSVLTGSLTQAIMSDNTILVGISAALYAFMIVFILDTLKANRMSFVNLIPLILINLGINFISTTAWLAHLGGLIAGYLLYLFYEHPDNKGPLILTVVMICLLFMKYISITKINPIYGGNDLEIVRIIKDLGFENYANKLLQRLADVYQRYGG